MGETREETPKSGKKVPKSREAFLDAASRLFAEQGYEGMRIRDVAKAAGTTLGTLHYYLGNKDSLVREICELQLRPLAEARLARYAALDETPAPGDRAERIAALLEAHFEPFVEIYVGTSAERSLVQNFYIRASSDPAPVVRAISNEVMRDMSRTFVRRLRALCDHLPDHEFYWRLNGVLGTTLHMQAFSDRLFELSKRIELEGDAAEYADVRSGIAPTVHFLTAAMTAPPMDAAGTGKG